MDSLICDKTYIIYKIYILYIRHIFYIYVCDKTYISETLRLFGIRLKEHKSEAEKASAKAFTRSQRKASITGEPNKSAIIDHVVNTNHVIGWEEATIKDREQDRVKRQIRESIWVRKQGQHSMNRDGGNYILPNIYDQLLMGRSPSTDKSRRTDRKLGLGSLAWRSVTL